MLFGKSLLSSAHECVGKRNKPFTQRLVPEMRKKSKIDLIGVPWPVNLLKCYRHTGEMQPGDEMIISLKDKDVKDGLVLILNAMPQLSFNVSTMGHGFAINVTKTRPQISDQA